MKPEDAFSKKSLRRYKALRKAIRKADLSGCYDYIPGRQRATDTSPERVYLDVMRRISPSHTARKRFYFHTKPHWREVEQIVAWMTQTWRTEKDSLR